VTAPGSRSLPSRRGRCEFYRVHRERRTIEEIGAPPYTREVEMGWCDHPKHSPKTFESLFRELGELRCAGDLARCLLSQEQWDDQT